MGLRVRLKASYDTSRFSPTARVIADALKRYGMILADNGSPWYITGASDPRFDDDVMHELDVITGRDLEVVDTTGLVNGSLADAASAGRPAPAHHVGHDRPDRPSRRPPGFVDLRSRLQAGETLYGSFATLGSPVATEILARVGFDWLMIDLEHGVTAESELIAHLHAVGTTPHGGPRPAAVRRSGCASDAPSTSARTG